MQTLQQATRTRPHLVAEEQAPAEIGSGNPDFRDVVRGRLRMRADIFAAHAVDVTLAAEQVHAAVSLRLQAAAGRGFYVREFDRPQPTFYAEFLHRTGERMVREPREVVGHLQHRALVSGIHIGRRVDRLA
jgi:hypothetical protein